MILYSGGYGCGKTLLGCYWSILKALQNPGSTGNIMSPTIKMLFDNIVQPNLLPLLDTLLTPRNYKFKRSQTEFSITLFNKSIIRLRAFDDEGKIRGADLNWLWLDEAIGKDRVYLTDSRFTQIRARLRKGDEQQFLITTNPGGQAHFLYKYFVQNQLDEGELPDSVNERAVYFGSIYDNKSLGEAYIMDMEASYPKDELLGLWSANVGAVYEQFNHSEHVHERLEDQINNRAGDYYLAIDFGYNNPFAALLLFVDKDDNIFILDEYYQTKMTPDVLTEELKSRFFSKHKISEVVADPADAGFVKYLRIHLPTHVRKGKKKVLLGINNVQKLLLQQTPQGRRLKIDSKCTNLIEEFGAYAWEPPREGVNEKEEPKKYMDHGLDALRYFVMTIMKNRGV
jgi:phage terminase large subunit